MSKYNAGTISAWSMVDFFIKTGYLWVFYKVNLSKRRQKWDYPTACTLAGISIIVLHSSAPNYEHSPGL